jgi:hypothetical protein
VERKVKKNLASWDALKKGDQREMASAIKGLADAAEQGPAAAQYVGKGWGGGGGGWGLSVEAHSHRHSRR